MDNEQLKYPADFAGAETQGGQEPQPHLRFASTLCVDDAPESLEKRIRRDPGDLNAHVQRIRYYQTQYDAPGCYAALVDLFIVLGPRGIDLRKRMASQTGFLLTPSLREFIENHLYVGISARTPLPSVTSSILTEAISGTTELVAAGTSDLPVH
ncbi:MAG: hypothetical protein L0Y38_09475 [Methylococcaceae bacterium]|nr:hypothetical protein [Methylococcaceae bacterium]MCI0734035.1 hypothetical protein [Methylococcaceae bacterium]